MFGFFPGQGYGGPPVSVLNFCQLMNEFDCYIITRNHDLNNDMPYNIPTNTWLKNDSYSILYLQDRDWNIAQFKEIITEIQPDLIYLQSLFQNCVIPILFISKKKGIKTILASRGELCRGAMKKKYKKIPYIIFLHVFGLINNNVYFQSTSADETEGIHKYLTKRNDRILNLTNIPTFYKESNTNHNKIAGEANFVFLSRINRKKNLKYALNLLRHLKGSISFDIYGPLEDSSYWSECQKLIEDLPDNVSVRYKGTVNHNKVCEVLSNYDCFLFPTLSENYGHVIVEALLAGLYVIVSDQTPWNDINDTNLGKAISLNDEFAFIDALQFIVDRSCKSDVNEFKAYLDKKVNYNKIHEEYLNQFKLISRN